MDDLASKLNSILNTKEGQEQLKNISELLKNSNNNKTEQNNNSNGFDFSVLSSLFNNQNKPQETPPVKKDNGFDISALSSLFNNQNQGKQENVEENNGMPNIDMNMILKIQQMMSCMSSNDKNTQLLIALKPHFKENRQKKVDQAISMIRLFSMLPMLKESGIFGNF